MPSLILMLSQCVSIASSQVYSDAPVYNRGNGFSLGSMVIGAINAGIFMFYLARMNTQKKNDQDSDESAARRGMTIEEIQDDHPDFFYYL